MRATARAKASNDLQLDLFGLVTASNMRELMAPLGCLLNDDAVMDLQVLRETNPLEAFFDTPKLLLPLSWAPTPPDMISTDRTCIAPGGSPT